MKTREFEGTVRLTNVHGGLLREVINPRIASGIHPDATFVFTKPLDESMLPGDGWTITEASTGLQVAHASTRALAIKAARDRLKQKMGPDWETPGRLKPYLKRKIN